MHHDSRKLTPRSHVVITGLLGAAVLSLLGCGGGGARSVAIARQLDPVAVGKHAIELYDADKNGAIDATELKQSPALTSALSRIDANKDGALSADEIAERIRQYQKQSDLVALALRLERNRAPVSGATVILEPDALIGDALVTFKGQSDASGAVALAADGADVPGMPVGLYRVQVSGPVEAIQGCEVAEDGPTGSRVTISL
jgi:hypothetical protein